MTVTVQYYAILRELSGVGKEEIELRQGSTGHTLLEAVVDRHPALGPYVSVIRLATETEYIKSDVHIEQGTVIALIPPVSGG